MATSVASVSGATNNWKSSSGTLATISWTNSTGYPVKISSISIKSVGVVNGTVSNNKDTFKSEPPGYIRLYNSSTSTVFCHGTVTNAIKCSGTGNYDALNTSGVITNIPLKNSYRINNGDTITLQLQACTSNGGYTDGSLLEDDGIRYGPVILTTQKMSAEVTYDYVYQENIFQHWASGFNGENSVDKDITYFNHSNNSKAYRFKETTATYAVGTAINVGSNTALASTNIPNGFELYNKIGYTIDDKYYYVSFIDYVKDLTQPDSSVTFEHYYNPISYNITYNLDGGINNTNNPSTYNILYGVSFQEPTKTAYKFLGWYDSNDIQIYGVNKDATNIGVFYTQQDFYNILSSRTTGDISVTAKWQPLTPTISTPVITSNKTEATVGFDITTDIGDYTLANCSITLIDLATNQKITTRNGSANQSGQFSATFDNLTPNHEYKVVCEAENAGITQKSERSFTTKAGEPILEITDIISNISTIYVKFNVIDNQGSEITSSKIMLIDSVTSDPVSTASNVYETTFKDNILSDHLYEIRCSATNSVDTTEIINTTKTIKITAPSSLQKVSLSNTNNIEQLSEAKPGDNLTLNWTPPSIWSNDSDASKGYTIRLYNKYKIVGKTDLYADDITSMSFNTFEPDLNNPITDIYDISESLPLNYTDNIQLSVQPFIIHRDTNSKLYSNTETFSNPVFIKDAEIIAYLKPRCLSIPNGAEIFGSDVGETALAYRYDVASDTGDYVVVPISEIDDSMTPIFENDQIQNLIKCHIKRLRSDATDYNNIKIRSIIINKKSEE